MPVLLCVGFVCCLVCFLFLLLLPVLFCFLVFGTVTTPQDCEACPDASLFTVGSMDAPCWLLYHGPIVTVNSFHAIAC